MSRLRAVVADLSFQRGSRRSFVFPARVVDILLRHGQHDPGASEAGGIMLGRIIADSDDIIVDEITTPSSSDRRTRFAFFRSVSAAQHAVFNAWRSSKGTRIYLGEWHSHPEPDPNPSRHDIENWRAIVRETRYEQHSLFFAIVGTRSIVVWELARSDVDPVRLDAERWDGVP